MRASHKYMLVFEDLDDTQREQITKYVKEFSVGWWHHMQNIWIVNTDKSAKQLVDEVKPFIPAGLHGRTLVFRLPELGTREWAGFGPPKWYEWLYSNYAEANGKSKRKPPLKSS